MGDSRDHVAVPQAGAPTMPATVARDGEALVFRGALERAAVAALWRQAQPLRAGVRRFDLAAVSRVDSAGLALLAELAAGGEDGDRISIVGLPAGLAELRATYRLDEGLNFAR